MTCYHPKVKTMGFPARNLIIADLLDRIADGGDRRTVVPSDRNRSIPSSYAKSPAAVRPAAAPGTPSDPFPYSTDGQQTAGYDSRDRARTGDTMHADGARVLRKGRLGVERADRITPSRDG